MVDYSSWKTIELSSDEDDVHPFIENGTLFRLRHEARLKKMEDRRNEEFSLECHKVSYKQRLEKLKNCIEIKLNEGIDVGDLQTQMRQLEIEEKEIRAKEDELNKRNIAMNGIIRRSFHTTGQLHEIRKMCRMRVVDNSVLGKQAMAEGKPPKVINIYNRQQIGTIGDVVLLAIKGEKKKGVIVGVVKTQRPNIPRFDTNNVVLIEHNGTPIGTRIHVPIPHLLRTILKAKTLPKSPDYTKLLAIATRFV